jgi:hypothetical protein
MLFLKNLIQTDKTLFDFYSRNNESHKKFLEAILSKCDSFLSLYIYMVASTHHFVLI